MKNKCGTYVEHNGEEYFVEGTWVPYVKATRIDPAEGGCFEELNIYNYAGIDIYEKLSDKEINDIVEKAEEQLFWEEAYA